MTSARAGALGRALPAVADFAALTKPRITAMVVATAAVGLALAPGAARAASIVAVIAGTALVVGAANAFNMALEHDTDAQMERTRDRPVAAGRIGPATAHAFAAALAVLSVPLLASAGALPVAIGLGALVTYVAIYTPMKRRSSFALLVGAIAGAAPPLMGWTAVTGRVDAGGALLFALLWLWQLPHFAAIALFRGGEYARAGLRVVGSTRGAASARRMIALSSVATVAASLFAQPARIGGLACTAAAAVVGAGYLAAIARGAAQDDAAYGRRAFAASIFYLVLVLGAYVVLRA